MLLCQSVSYINSFSDMTSLLSDPVNATRNKSFSFGFKLHPLLDCLSLFWMAIHVHQGPEEKKIIDHPTCVTKREACNKGNMFYQQIQSEERLASENWTNMWNASCDFEWNQFLFRLLRPFNLCLRITKCHLNLRSNPNSLFSNRSFFRLPFSAQTHHAA